jgi:hypothetical protein
MGRRRAIGALIGLGLAGAGCGDGSESGGGEAGQGPRAEVAVQTRTGGERGLILERTDDGWKILNLSEGSHVARQDRRAINSLNAAALAFGGYRTANGGSFAGARARDLQRHNSAAPLNAEVTSTRDTFTVAVTSRSGNVFRIRGFMTRRGLIGIGGRTCRVPGVGDCPADGTWD